MVNAHSDEPPQLKNGSGIPTTGASPMVMPMLIAKWKNKMDATPYP